ncbi:MAG: PilZ domain-containing protein [Candidatus Omnitrophica bacterium]|nr:PilZ domain-containing protein [Candidatus Omnitrophota bacterium]MBU4589470.1 PilZ domain-containing protein [Candidatus Omnitrophota bacterium]
MYLAYSITLILLTLILMLLWKEEKAFRKNLTYGLASKYWALRERRRYVRFDDEVKIRYNLVRNSRNSLLSKTSNISKKGLCLITYEKFKKKTYLDLELDVPGFSKPVKLVGQVAWLKELKNRDAADRRLFYVGIRFSKIKPECEAILLTHLNKLK